MTDTAVRRLTLTLPHATSPHGARARIEDALRCAGDEPRLLLVSRLRLGALPVGKTWTARTAAALRRAAAVAVHAGAPGAAQAEAAYFADALEARALLIAWLAAGRRPVGWFWQLAVPEWDGTDFPVAAARLLPALFALPGGPVALARVTRRLVDSGRLTEFLAPISDTLAGTLMAHLASPPVRASLAETQGGGPDRTPYTPVRRIVSPQASGHEGAPADDAVAATSSVLADVAMVQPAARLAQRILSALAAASRRALREALAGRATDDQVALWLATQIVLAEASHLAGLPTLLAEATIALRRAIAADISVSATRSQAIRPPPSRPRAEGRSDLSAPAIVVPAKRSPLAVSETATISSTEEQRSEAAGLFLLVRPLARMGLAEWLQRHPQQALDGFAWALLRAIAIRMRVRAIDPIWTALPAEASPDEWLDAWRVGLDCWLRRQTGARLYEIVRRRGWLVLGEASIVARFALDDADIRLRRHALDVDPGWVPWLGQTVRYAYGERPIGHDRG